MTYKNKPRLAGRGSFIAYNNNQQANHSILDRHYCCCRPGTVCIFCLTWNRLIRRIEARMAWRAMA
jgi:hypothetical protein